MQLHSQSSLVRRWLLTGILAGLVLLSGCQTENGPSINKSPTDPFERIVESARWAQNAHNIQSWRLWRVDATTVRGGLDPARLLPKTDPFDRQLILSLGSFTEAARLAAEAQGQHLAVRWIAPENWDPQNNPQIPVFEWTLSTSASDLKTDSPADVGIDVLASPTVKYKVKPARLIEGFSNGGVSRFDRAGVRFTVVEKGQDLDKIVQLSREAYRIEMTAHDTLMESVNYTVYGAQARAEHPYGITLLGNFDQGQVGFMEFLAGVFRQSPEDYGRSGIDMIGKVLDQCEQVVVLTTTQNTPEAQFEAGQALQQMWMAALAQGDVLLPLSQGLQEAQQYDNVRTALFSLLARPGETVQMVLAVGKPDGKFLRAPRIEAKLLFVKEGS